ncbi:hypothetical protein G7Y79_00028g062550 [Physcia stellaris]|nr:hypothetical protein G7Y79_00028g062550 [Physcia stellaris]
MSENVGMSSCCLSGAIHDGTPTGRVDTLGGLQTYIAEPRTGSKAKSVIFISDSARTPVPSLSSPLTCSVVFGWELTNTRLLADEYAKEGFYVYLPDFHQGDSLPIDFLQNVEPPLKKQETLTVTEKAKNTAVVPVTLGPWLLTHRESVTRPLIDGFINTVRNTPGTNKIGALGFCWGGRYAILQAHGQSKDGSGSDIGGVDAAVVAIPGDFDPITKPLSLAVGTKDSLLDMDSIGKIQDLLAKKTEVPHELQIYEDQVHGFALRSDWSSEKDKKAMDDAQKQGVAWFSKYLA